MLLLMMKPISTLMILLGTILLVSFQTQLAYAENDGNNLFSWFQKSLEKVWESIVKINPNNQENQQVQENDKVEESQKHETPPSSTIETLTEEPVEDGVIEKKFTHGDTEFTYMVGVENGVEETPSPEVLRAMRASYSEEELENQQKIIDEIVRNGPQGMGKVIGFDGVYIDVNKAYKNTQIHVNNKLKKQYIDTNFTCDNYHALAKKFVGESMYGVGYAGSVENYIYSKALDECISPKHQEELDKVNEELEEVYKEN